MEAEIDLQRYLGVLRRRWLYLVVPAVVVALVSTAIAFTLPPAYRASATILVESQQIPTALASPTVTSDAAERIRVIEQRLLARENLLQVADKYGLYRQQGSIPSLTPIVESMRDAIDIAQIDTFGARGNGAVVGFTVTFQYTDPSIAARVTNELVTSILAQNVESRLSRASETSEFFAQQKSDLEQRLLALEHRIAEYKRTNEADLPDTLEIRRKLMAEIRLLLRELDQQIRAVAATGEVVPTGAEAAGLQQLSFNLQATQLELASHRARRAELAPLWEKGIIPTNQIRDLDDKIALAELNVKSIEAQIAARGGSTDPTEMSSQLRAQRSELEQQAEELNQSILRTPLVQVELNSMQREYENLQIEYREALARLEQAQTGERLEAGRQSERFEVIEQATVPDEPASPDRPKIVIAGFGAGIIAGGTLLALVQMLDRRIYSVADVERVLQLRPLVTIPYVATQRERQRKFLQIALLILGCGGVAAAAVVSVDTYVLPIDFVFDRIMIRIAALMSRVGLDI